MNWYGLITLYVIATGFSAFSDIFNDSEFYRVRGCVQMLSATILMGYVELWAR